MVTRFVTFSEQLNRRANSGLVGIRKISWQVDIRNRDNVLRAEHTITSFFFFFFFFFSSSFQYVYTLHPDVVESRPRKIAWPLIVNRRVNFFFNSAEIELPAFDCSFALSGTRLFREIITSVCERNINARFYFLFCSLLSHKRNQISSQDIFASRILSGYLVCIINDTSWRDVYVQKFLYVRWNAVRDLGNIRNTKAGRSHEPLRSSRHLRLAEQDVLGIVRLFRKVGHSRLPTAIVVRIPAPARRPSRRTVECAQPLSEIFLNKLTRYLTESNKQKFLFVKKNGIFIFYFIFLFISWRCRFIFLSMDENFRLFFIKHEIFTSR